MIRALFLLFFICFSSASVSSVEVLLSSSRGGNSAELLMDDDFSTAWSSYGDGHWVRVGLSGRHTLDSLDIAFPRGDQRDAYFNIESSIDGQNWQLIWAGIQPIRTLSLQTIDFPAVVARYVRVVGFGNSHDEENSISELRLNFDDHKLLVDPYSHLIQEADTAYYLDKDLGDKTEIEVDFGAYTSLGGVTQGVDENGHAWLEVDLGYLTPMNAIEFLVVAQVKQHFEFDVLIRPSVSDPWVVQLQSIYGMTDGVTPNVFDFGSTVTARYIRYVGRGDMKSIWRSLSQMRTLLLDRPSVPPRYW